MIKKIVFTLFMLLLTIPCHAIDGKIIKTTDYTFKERWNNTEGQNVPLIITCDTIYPNQKSYINIYVANYEVNSLEFGSAQYAITVFRPDSSIYLEKKHLIAFHRKIAHKEYVQMSDSIVTLCFDNVDMLGDYQIEIALKDNISNKTIALREKITLTRLPVYNENSVDDTNKFLSWFNRYYRDPHPIEAIAYYVFYSKSSLSNNDNGFFPILSFFSEILKNHNYLMPYVLDSFKTSDIKTRIYILYLMINAKVGTVDFYKSLGPDEQNICEQIRKAPPPDLYSEITAPYQLDMLWGAFLGSGSYQPILKLIKTLDLAVYKDDYEKFAKSEHTKEDQEKAIKSLVYSSLVWSMKSNCQQHPLVKDYCRWALRNEELTEVQKEELQKILLD